MWGVSKKPQKREKHLCIPQEKRRSSMKVGEIPGNGEESPSFGEEPEKCGECQRNTIKEKLLCIPQEKRRSSMKVGETPGNGEELPSFEGESLILGSKESI